MELGVFVVRSGQWCPWDVEIAKLTWIWNLPYTGFSLKLGEEHESSVINCVPAKVLGT